LSPATFYLIVGIGTVIIFLIGGIVAYTLIANSRDKNREIFAVISERVGGRIKSSGLSGPQVVGHYQGIPYKIYILPGNQYSTPDLRIEFTGGLPFTLTLQSEGLNSKLERLVGFGSGKNIELGIPEFDQKFAVRTTEPEKTRAYFQKPEVRKTLEEITGQGASFLFRGKYAEIIVPLEPPSDSQNLLDLKAAGELIDIAKVEALLERGAFLLEALWQV
jgi:hypothetical protein